MASSFEQKVAVTINNLCLPRSLNFQSKRHGTEILCANHCVRQKIIAVPSRRFLRLFKTKRSCNDNMFMPRSISQFALVSILSVSFKSVALGTEITAEYHHGLQAKQLLCCGIQS